MHVHQFFKIKEVFHTLCLWIEVGSPQFFGAFLTQVTYYLIAIKIFLKIYGLENFRANVFNE